MVHATKLLKGRQFRWECLYICFCKGTDMYGDLCSRLTADAAVPGRLSMLWGSVVIQLKYPKYG